MNTTVSDTATHVVDNLRSAAKGPADVLRREAHHTKDVAERYIGSKPWHAAAIIGAVGFVVGALFTRR